MMRVGTYGFDGIRLRQARRARGLSGVDLAAMVGVKSQTISAYEWGKGTPSPKVMEDLASKLNFPLAFFQAESPQQEDAPIYWRANSTATRVAQDRAEVRLDWLREILLYLREFFDFPQPRLPRIDIPSDFRLLTTDQIEDAAGLCRRLWELGEGPIASVMREIEANGIITAEIEINAEKLDAFSQWAKTDETPYVILSSDKASGPRRAFDISHELGHLVLHRSVDQRRVNTPSDWKILEDQAHRFASAFLMPAETFAREVWAPSLDAFVAMKPRWRVSVQAMIMRCRHLGMLSEEQERSLWINLNRRGWKRVEPLDDKISLEHPGLVQKSIEMLVEAGVRRPDQILLDLPFPPSDLEEITSMPRGYFTNPPASVISIPRLKPELVTKEASNPHSGDVIAFERIKRP